MKIGSGKKMKRSDVLRAGSSLEGLSLLLEL
jgi:hypothetical protein